MGNWHISIKGAGSHHNGSPNDAEQLAAEFVKKLQASGAHTVTSADVTIGGAQPLLTDQDRAALMALKGE
jgi:hypothetical protein